MEHFPESAPFSLGTTESYPKDGEQKGSKVLFEIRRVKGGKIESKME